MYYPISPFKEGAVTLASWKTFSTSLPGFTSATEVHHIQSCAFVGRTYIKWLIKRKSKGQTISGQHWQSLMAMLAQHFHRADWACWFSPASLSFPCCWLRWPLSIVNIFNTNLCLDICFPVNSNCGISVVCVCIFSYMDEQSDSSNNTGFLYALYLMRLYS